MSDANGKRRGVRVRFVEKPRRVPHRRAFSLAFAAVFFLRLSGAEAQEPQGAAAPSPKDDAPLEVTVHGGKSSPGTQSLKREEVRQLPGAFGDPFRALDAMPGVTPIVSGLPFFYVRGAPPGNIGYYLDGVRVPYLFHVGAGPSVIHPGMVDHVDLYPGGYPARYGRFAGGIVAAESTAPRADLHGEGNVRVFDLGALVEKGFDDGRGSALVAGRYSYTAAILSLVAKDTTLDYRDYEARVSYDLTPKDRVSAFTFGSFDLVGQNENGIDNVLFASEFYRLDTRWDHSFDGDRTKARVAVTLGYDQTRIPGQPRTSRDAILGTRAELTHRVSSRLEVHGGADAMLDHYTADERPYADPEDPETRRFNALFPPRNDVTLGAWADGRLLLDGGRWELTPGVRVDLFHSGNATTPAVDPRVSSRVHVAKRVSVIHTFGLAHQAPSFLIPIPGLSIGQLSGGLQESIQSSAGVEVEVAEATTASLTAFDNVFRNMSDTLGVSQNRGVDVGFEDHRSQGSAIGLELFVKRKLTKRFGGYLSYTLSRSTRSVGRERFLSAFDRPHVANAAIGYDLGRRWRAGARFTVYSGTPVVPPNGTGLIPPPRSLDPDRDAAFYRLDLRLEKRWNLNVAGTTWISFVAEVMNATLNQEVVQGTTIGPVTIPSVGVEGGI